MAQEAPQPQPAAESAPARQDQPEAKETHWNTSWTLTDVDVAQLTSRLNSIGFTIPVELSGKVTVNLIVGVPHDNPANLRNYQFNGSLIGTDLTIENVTFPQLSAVLNYQHGKLELSKVTGTTATGKFSGSATAMINPLGEFQIQAQGNDLILSELLGLYFDSTTDLVNGKVDFRAQAKGDFAADEQGKPRLNIAVDLASPDFRLLGLDLGLIEHRLRIAAGQFSLTPLHEGSDTDVLLVRRVQGQYSINRDQIQLSSVSAELFGGTVDAEGAFQLSDSGMHQIRAHWNGIQPTFHLPIDNASRDIKLAGTTSGKMNWSAPVGKLNFPAFHDIAADLSVDPLQWQSEELGSLEAVLKISDAQFQLNAQGDLLDGRMEVVSQGQIESTMSWEQIPSMMFGGQMLVRDVSIERAIDILTAGRNRRYRGRLSGESEFRYRPAGTSQLESSLTLRDLMIDGHSVSSRMKASLAIDGQTMDLKLLRGNYAAGQIQADGQWSLGRGKRSIQLRLSRARGDRVLLPLSPSASTWTDGLVSGRATIVGNGSDPFDHIRVIGSLSVDDGQLFAMPVGDAHSSFQANWSRNPFRWRVEFPNIRSRVARGSVSGQLELASSAGSRRGLNIDSTWRANHVDFQTLLSRYLGSSTIGHGDLTGTMTLIGRNVESVDDLLGQYRARLGGSDASAIPGLTSVGAAFGPISLAGERFQSGIVEGRIARGAIQVKRMTLESERVRVEAAGRIGIANGRMDIRGSVQTGNFQGETPLTETVIPFVASSVVPLATVNRQFSNRTVVFDMLGNVSDPQIRVLSAETIQANLRDQLIRQGVSLIVTGSMFGGD